MIRIRQKLTSERRHGKAGMQRFINDQPDKGLAYVFQDPVLLESPPPLGRLGPSTVVIG